MVGKKLYVGNLTYRTNSSDLEQLFSQFGSVQSAEVISDRDTGRSKGFGFVEMSTDAEAKAAIDGLHDSEVDGRRLTVNEARPREPRTGGGGKWWRLARRCWRRRGRRRQPRWSRRIRPGPLLTYGFQVTSSARASQVRPARHAVDQPHPGRNRSAVAVTHWQGQDSQS